MIESMIGLKRIGAAASHGGGEMAEGCLHIRSTSALDAGYLGEGVQAQRATLYQIKKDVSMKLAKTVQEFFEVR